LQIYQIPVVDTRVAREEEEAVEIAKELGFPVVLKLHSETIIHKSEVGGVKLNLTSAETVKHAFRSIRESCGRLRGRQHFQGVVIYRMIDKPRDTYEVMLGSMIDAQAGPDSVWNWW
jgi:acetyltransferase